MVEFKPGDKVKRIGQDNNGVVRGGVYTVKKIFDTTTLYLIDFNANFHIDYFEIYNENYEIF